MPIDTSGEWWVSSEPEDVEPYLDAYWESLEVSAFRLARCSCGGISFALKADDDEGVAQRSCGDCGSINLICDSAEHWDNANPLNWVCVCGAEAANIGIAFSFYDEKDESGEPVIRWLSIGTRCIKCGVLGCFASWKVGYSPSAHLLDQV